MAKFNGYKVGAFSLPDAVIPVESPLCLRQTVQGLMAWNWEANRLYSLKDATLCWDGAELKPYCMTRTAFEQYFKSPFCGGWDDLLERAVHIGDALFSEQFRSEYIGTKRPRYSPGNESDWRHCRAYEIQDMRSLLRLHEIGVVEL